jgi:hypothetical protein
MDDLSFSEAQDRVRAAMEPPSAKALKEGVFWELAVSASRPRADDIPPQQEPIVASKRGSDETRLSLAGAPRSGRDVRLGPMQPQEIVVLVTAGGVFVALVGSIVSNVVAVRGQQLQGRIATRTEDHNQASAERSEAAARLQIDQTERVITALETLASKDMSATGVAPRPLRVRWKLSHHAGDTYALENIGTATAFAVSVSAHESLMLANSVQGGPELNPGEALTFMAVLTYDTSDTTITTRWRDSVDATAEQRTWRYPLPSRPPR